MSPLLRKISAWASENQWPCTVTPSTQSTNDDARNFVGSRHRWLCASDHQTRGRGRGDHVWVDNGADLPGAQLLLSLGFEVMAPPQPIVTTRVGHALWRASESTWPGLPWGLKPPNDLLLGGRKVAGVLIEAVQTADSIRWVVGLGLNITWHPTQIESRPSSSPLATSLAQHDPAAEVDVLRFVSSWCQACEGIARTCAEPQLREPIRGELESVLRRQQADLRLAADGGYWIGDKHHPWMLL